MSQPMLNDFVCYYCGELKAADDRSNEHIIPSCIGGNRNVTLSTEVCSGCQKFTGDEVDRPFCRDWFIEAMRLIVGVSHRGKRPVHFMGKLNWAREERVSSYLLESGANIFAIECQNGDRAIAVLADLHNDELMTIVRNVVKTRFSDMRVINWESPRTMYDDELWTALLDAGPGFNVTYSFDHFSWDRAVVKMALGLACQTFGTEFIASKSAFQLRAFMREHDPDKRATLGLRGRGGFANSEPLITAFIHPGGNEHLFALMSRDGRISFAANLFGWYENIVIVDDCCAYGEQLPGDVWGDIVRGVTWIIDPVAKTTRGPVPIDTLMQVSR